MISDYVHGSEIYWLLSYFVSQSVIVHNYREVKHFILFLCFDGKQTHRFYPMYAVWVGIWIRCRPLWGEHLLSYNRILRASYKCFMYPSTLPRTADMNGLVHFTRWCFRIHHQRSTLELVHSQFSPLSFPTKYFFNIVFQYTSRHIKASNRIYVVVYCSWRHCVSGKTHQMSE